MFNLDVFYSAGLAVALICFVWRRWFSNISLSNVPGPPSASWWQGNLHLVYNRNGWAYNRYLAKSYGAAVKINSLFGSKALYIFDPLALQHMTTTEPSAYGATESFVVSNALVVGKGLIGTQGDRHRRQRKMLNPLFSPSRMRELFPVFNKISQDLRYVLSRHLQQGDEEIDMSKYMSRAGLAFIAEAGIGHSFGTLEETNEYEETVKKMAPTAGDLMVVRELTPDIVKLAPLWFRRKLMDIMPVKALREMKEIVDTLYNKCALIYTERKENLERDGEGTDAKVSQGKDIMTVLLKSNMMSADEDRLTEEEVIGQMNTFLFAGSDTTSAGLSRAVYQLALREEVQRNLRTEIANARKQHTELTYDIIMNLPYLDAVCRETLRVFPPAPRIFRRVKRDVNMPLLWPIKSPDGVSEIDSIFLRKGTYIIVSIWNANTNKAIWGDDAEEWKPERWLNRAPNTVANVPLSGIYSSMMTFFGGPRSCIGLKFAEMEMKVVLSTLIENFTFSPGSKEIEWHMNDLAVPVIKGSNNIVPSLPMKLSFVRDRVAKDAPHSWVNEQSGGDLRPHFLENNVPYVLPLKGECRIH